MLTFFLFYDKILCEIYSFSEENMEEKGRTPVGMIKAILFDVDDTLLSFGECVKESMKAGFERFSLPSYDDSMFDVFSRINSEFWNRIEQGEITLDDLKRDRWNRIFGELGIDFDGPTFETYFRENLFNSAIPMPGALELLDSLGGKYPLYVASNGPYLQQKNRLEKAGMFRYFSDVFVSEKLGVSKPSFDFFRLCVEKINEKREEPILPGEILMVGDSLSTDIMGGKRAGLLTCWYRAGSAETDVDCDFKISSLLALKKIL